MNQSPSTPAHKTLYNADSEALEIPAETVTDWRFAVANNDTVLGLLDFHLERGDTKEEHETEILRHLDSDLDQRALTEYYEGQIDGEIALRAVLLAVIEPITHRESPARVARFIIDRPSIEKKLSLANRETLLLALEDLMSQPHTNDQVADTVLEYLDK